MLVFLATACIVLLAPAFLKDVKFDGSRACKKPRIFAGVFTGAGGAPKYADRRAMLRASWFPNTKRDLERLECMYGVTLRFVVGRLTDDAQYHKEWNEEVRAHGDFLELNVIDGYHNLTAKSTEYFHHVLSLPQEYEYAVKVDDDMFVSPSHLVKAVDQWANMKVDYAGCMVNPGPIFKEEGHVWYEPLHDLLASKLHMYACGAMYALSRSAMTHVFKEGAESHRVLANEDQAMGFWMLAHNVVYFDDQRLCASTCDSSHAFVGVNHGTYCNGLKDPSHELPALDAQAECQAAPPAQLPFLKSKFQRFNKMMEDSRATRRGARV